MTGGSGGIGRSLAECFAGGGYDVVITGRSEPALAAAARDLRRFGGSVTTVPGDLSHRAEVERLVQTIRHSGIDVDVLVNNAGFGTAGDFARSDPEAQLEMVMVNVGALTQLTRALLPPMLQRGSGRILNVASTAAFQPGPYFAVYYATKAYVLSFSEAIAEELRDTGVTVTTLCPGPTATGFAARAGLVASPLFQKRVVMTAADVARAGYEGALRGDRIVVPGAANRLIAGGVRFLPRGLVTRIGRRLNVSRSALP